MPTMTPPEPPTIHLRATACDVPPEPIRRLEAQKRVRTAVSGCVVMLLGIGIMTRDPGGLLFAAPGALLVAVALLRTLRHLADEGATTFLRTTGAVRLEHDTEAFPEWELCVEAADVRIDITIDEDAADQLQHVRWALVDYTPDAHALIRVQDIRGVLLYGQPDPCRDAQGSLATPEGATGGAR